MRYLTLILLLTVLPPGMGPGLGEGTMGTEKQSWYWITPPAEGKRLADLAQGDKLFVALLNPDGGKVLTPGRSSVSTSHDGVHWHASDIRTDGIYARLVYRNNLFVAVGRSTVNPQAGTIVTSRDGLHWTEGTTTMHALTNVLYGNNTFVAVGLHGTIVTSVNGTDWHESIRKNDGHLYAGDYGNTLFVLVGDVATLTSPDARHWTPHANQDLHLPLGLRQITFGNAVFLLGSDKALFTSPDGTHWHRTTIDLSLQEMVYTRQTFFARRGDGAILTSSDGIHWTPGPRLRENGKDVSCHSHHCIALGKHILVIGPR